MNLSKICSITLGQQVQQITIDTFTLSRKQVVDSLLLKQEPHIVALIENKRRDVAFCIILASTNIIPYSSVIKLENNQFVIFVNGILHCRQLLYNFIKLQCF